jgi:uncharacterized protein YfbU (UPF0304 family)
MPTITLRVDDQTKDDLDALARSRGSTVTDLLRPLVDEAIGRATERPRGVHPVHLSLVDRRVLSLLHEVLGRLDSDLEQHHRLRAEVLDAGYAAEYGDEFVSVEPELTGRDCEFVWDVLDMFQILKASMDELGPAAVTALDEHAEAFLTFGGFDLNDPFESRLLGYARYLLATDRWTDMALYFDDKHERGNSHMRTVPIYRRMLEVYTPLVKAKMNERGFNPKQYLFGADELAAVVVAAVHPDHRQG